VRRGLGNMHIQAFLTAAAVDLKRLAMVLLRLLLRRLWGVSARGSVVGAGGRALVQPSRSELMAA
jgi:hypothetical protein